MTLDDVRLSLVDKIMNSENKILLEKISQFFNSEYPLEDLSKEQLEMLKMSEADIKYGRTIEDTDLDASL